MAMPGSSSRPARSLCGFRTRPRECAPSSFTTSITFSPAYPTTWTGEAEIGAWEIASGCGRHYPAWFLNFGALGIGLLIAPRHVFRAFVRGRHSLNLYHGEFEEGILDATVGEMRAQLAIPGEIAEPSTRDALAFVFWSAVSVAVSGFPALAVVTLGLWLVWKTVR